MTNPTNPTTTAPRAGTRVKLEHDGTGYGYAVGPSGVPTDRPVPVELWAVDHRRAVNFDRNASGTVATVYVVGASTDDAPAVVSDDGMPHGRVAIAPGRMRTPVDVYTVEIVRGREAGTFYAYARALYGTVPDTAAMAAWLETVKALAVDTLRLDAPPVVDGHAETVAAISREARRGEWYGARTAWSTGDAAGFQLEPLEALAVAVEAAALAAVEAFSGQGVRDMPTVVDVLRAAETRAALANIHTN